MLFRRITYAFLMVSFCIHTSNLDAQGGNPDTQVSNPTARDGYIDSVGRCIWGMFKKTTSTIVNKAASLTNSFLTEVCSQQQPQLETLATTVVEQQIPRLEEAASTIVMQNTPLIQASAEQTAATIVEQQIPRLEEAVSTIVTRNIELIQERAEQTAANIVEQQIPRLKETVSTTISSQVPRLCYTALSSCVGLFGAYTSCKSILQLITARTYSKNALAPLSFGIGALATSIIATHFLWRQPHVTNG